MARRLAIQAHLLDSRPGRTTHVHAYATSRSVGDADGRLTSAGVAGLLHHAHLSAREWQLDTRGFEELHPDDIVEPGVQVAWEAAVRAQPVIRTTPPCLG